MTTRQLDAPQTVGLQRWPALVRQVRLEAQGVVSVLLEHPNGDPLPAWDPGAHIDLHLPNQLTRQYSLCGTPSDRTAYRIGVLREARSSGGSEYVHTFLRAGQQVRLSGPRNTFRQSDQKHKVFVAGGIGITPILAMVRQVAEAGSSWELHYGGRSSTSMAFLGELAELAELAGNAARVHFYPADSTGPMPLPSLLSEPRPEAAVYACGPEGLLHGIEEEMAHWPRGSLHVERFAARPKSTEPNTAIEIDCVRSGRTVLVPPERSVLEALEEAGLPVASSCRNGVCGTCETRILGGVAEHRDDILEGDDRTTGDRMFVCVSRARTPNLALDL